MRASLGDPSVENFFRRSCFIPQPDHTDTARHQSQDLSIGRPFSNPKCSQISSGIRSGSAVAVGSIPKTHAVGMEPTAHVSPLTCRRRRCIVYVCSVVGHSIPSLRREYRGAIDERACSDAQRSALKQPYAMDCRTDSEADNAVVIQRGRFINQFYYEAIA